MQCIVYWGPQRPGSGVPPQHLALALRNGPPFEIFALIVYQSL